MFYRQKRDWESCETVPLMNYSILIKTFIVLVSTAVASAASAKARLESSAATSGSWSAKVLRGGDSAAAAAMFACWAKVRRALPGPTRVPPRVPPGTAVSALPGTVRGPLGPLGLFMSSSICMYFKVQSTRNFPSQNCSTLPCFPRLAQLVRFSIVHRLGYPPLWRYSERKLKT